VSVCAVQGCEWEATVTLEMVATPIDPRDEPAPFSVVLCPDHYRWMLEGRPEIEPYVVEEEEP
jgi:hypothetical protein